MDGPDGAAMGPPEILPDHVPVPPPGPPGGFSGVGGFGRGAIGPLPPDYPAPAIRLVLRNLRLLLQLCCSPGDNDGAAHAHYQSITANRVSFISRYILIVRWSFGGQRLQRCTFARIGAYSFWLQQPMSSCVPA